MGGVEEFSSGTVISRGTRVGLEVVKGLRHLRILPVCKVKLGEDEYKEKI